MREGQPVQVEADSGGVNVEVQVTNNFIVQVEFEAELKKKIFYFQLLSRREMRNIYKRLLRVFFPQQKAR